MRRELDLLHVHYAIPHATSAWIAREMLGQTRPDIKVLTTLHGTDITIVGQDPSFHAITKFSIEKSDGLTAVSQYLRDGDAVRVRLHRLPDRGDPELHRPGRLRPHALRAAAARAGRTASGRC